VIECLCVCTCCSTQVFLLPDTQAEEVIHCPRCTRDVITLRLQPFDEAQWLACTDPLVLTQWKGPTATERKRRLFACACCRLLWARLAAPRARVAVEVAERYADGLATVAELATAHERALALSPAYTFNDLMHAAAHTAGGNPSTHQISGMVMAVPGTHRSVVSALFRDILGNPFRPLAARGFPAHVAGLARACCEAFPAVGAGYAILADALEELGETEAATHCRQPLHARGCHVLDWILGKS
jgi:hypothetical protein